MFTFYFNHSIEATSAKNDSKREAHLSYRVAIRLNCLVLAKLRES